MAKFNDLNIFSIGNTIQMVGAVYSGEGKSFICYFPEENHEQDPELLEMNLDEWRQLIKQADLLEVEVLDKSPAGDIIKAIMRKSARQVEEGSRWKVYQRDSYKCRYCGKSGIPLTVDHVICWEALGPTIEMNLVSCCKKCNKVRGEIPYEDWLMHPHYRKVSVGLDERTKKLNQDLVLMLGNIPLRPHARSR